MIKVSARAKQTLNKLCVQEYRKIDNGGKAFMPVTVEKLETTKLGEVWSVAHYYRQNGDLMRDPEMLFLKGGDGEWYPLSFQQDGLGYVNHVACAKTGAYIAKRQKDLATFTTTWMKNIKEQQGKF